MRVAGFHSTISRPCAAPAWGITVSLVRRTSEAMGYESIGRVVAILAERGRLPPHLNQLVPGRVCNYLAALLHQSTRDLSSLTVHHYAPSLVLVRRPAASEGSRFKDDSSVLLILLAGLSCLSAARRGPLRTARVVVSTYPRLRGAWMHLHRPMPSLPTPAPLGPAGRVSVSLRPAAR